MKKITMPTIAPVNLHFEDSGEWYSLPDWAEYFINVGKQLSHAKQSHSRIITAIIVPTRAYGAAFVSLGMVISNAAARDHTSVTDHFEKLFDLQVGSSVIFRPGGGKTLRGVLKAPEEYKGKLHVKVQVHSKEGGGLTYLVDESHALQVQPAMHSRQLPKKQGTENTRFANKFVDSILGDSDPVQLGLRSKLCCAIVGKKSTLEYEIRKTPLAIHVNGDQYAEGQLQDVLRVDRFVSEKQSYRSVLVPVGSKQPPSDIVENVQMGVVFDGAHGFLKWSERWNRSHQIVILDRTEPYFDDAISAINSRFSQNRVDGENSLPRMDAPDGGEVLSFREAPK